MDRRRFLGTLGHLVLALPLSYVATGCGEEISKQPAGADVSPLDAAVTQDIRADTRDARGDLGGDDTSPPQPDAQDAGDSGQSDLVDAGVGDVQAMDAPMDADANLTPPDVYDSVEDSADLAVADITDARDTVDTVDAVPALCTSFPTDIGRNHDHELIVAPADVEAAVDKTYDITGTSDHPHTLTITGPQFVALATTGAPLVIDSSYDDKHIHTCTISCA